jgi:hypothetical protein
MGRYIDVSRYTNLNAKRGNTMNQSFGSWMLTGGTNSEVHAEARQQEQLHAFRELQAERRAARRGDHPAAYSAAIRALRARFASNPTELNPDCCPA